MQAVRVRMDAPLPDADAEGLSQVQVAVLEHATPRQVVTPHQPDDELLIRLVLAIRPDWTPHAVTDALTAEKLRPWQHRMTAVLRLACDPATLHPSRLSQPGPWWLEPGEGTPIPPNLRGPDVCQDHKKRRPCAGCAADRLAVEDETVPA